MESLIVKEAILKALEQVQRGAKRIGLIAEDSKVVAYRVGDMIRIDIKSPKPAVGRKVVIAQPAIDPTRDLEDL